jgi:hypothetical protein
MNIGDTLTHNLLDVVRQDAISTKQNVFLMIKFFSRVKVLFFTQRELPREYGRNNPVPRSLQYHYEVS